MKPLISILVPAFNAESWICETIKSALAQTWPRKEIIIVDDGSTDGTLSTAKHFASRSLAVISQPNGGAAAARNRALAASQGKYIQWLDADDLLPPEKIQAQMDTVVESDGSRTLLSGPWAHFIHHVSRARFRASSLWQDLSPLDWLLRKMGENLHMQTGTWLVSRELTEAAGSWDTRLSLDDDGEYFCRVLMASRGTRFVSNARTYYRKHGLESLSGAYESPGKLESQWLSMELHIKYLLALEESERTRAVCLKYVRTWLPYFYPRRPDLFEKAKQTAAFLGGSLEPPRSSWKYACLERALGSAAANKAQFRYNRLKSSLASCTDRALSWFEPFN